MHRSPYRDVNKMLGAAEFTRAAINTRTANPVPHGENCLEIVVLQLAETLVSNYPEFPDSSLTVQLGFVVNMLRMFVNGANIALVQFRQQQPRQPDRAPVKPPFHVRAAARTS